MRWAPALVVFAACATAGPPPERGQEDARFGLFIGINEYPGKGIPDLQGCVNDAKLLKSVFERWFDVERSVLLTDEGAKKADIEQAFADLLAQVKAAKEGGAEAIRVVITFSGHGSRVEDEDGDEEDGRDETWVPHDGGWTTNQIPDDWIRARLAELTDLGAQVFFLSDSCHSGTVTRGLAERGFGDATRGAARMRPPEPGVVFFTACGDLQRAQEIKRRRKAYGRFTLAFHDALKSLSHSDRTGVTCTQLKARIAAELAAQSPPPPKPQDPQLLVARGMESVTFFDGELPPDHTVVVPESLRGQTVEIERGALEGVGVGTAVRFYRDLRDLEREQRAVAEGEVVEVRELTALVRLEKAAVLEDAVARIEESAYPSFRVRAEGDVPVPKGMRAGEDEACNLVVRRRGDLFELCEPDGTVAAEERDEKNLARRLEYMARLCELLELRRNEDKFRVTLVAEEPLRHGDTFDLRFENASGRKLFVHVLQFRQPDGRGARGLILQDDDPDIGSRTLEAGGSTWAGWHACYEGDGFERTVFKILACTEEIPPAYLTSLEPPRLRGAPVFYTATVVFDVYPAPGGGK